MKNIRMRNKTRERRAARARSRIRGTAQCPRLTIFKSNQYLYLQLIDDQKGHTIASASTRTPERKPSVADAINRLAHAVSDAAVKAAVLDRGYYKYHGIIKTVADTLRKKGVAI